MDGPAVAGHPVARLTVETGIAADRAAMGSRRAGERPVLSGPGEPGGPSALGA